MKTKRILECTFNELAECGFKRVSVDNIAAKMHVSKKTIYDMFENKEKLLLSAVEYKIGKIIEGFSPSLEKGDNVTVEVLERICIKLNCSIGDVIEIVSDGN